MHNTDNYMEQGGRRWVVGGELALTDTGKITKGGKEIEFGGGGSKSTVSHLKPIADPTKATIEEVATAYNALLAALKA
ncbi:hypothetical protein [Paenibacillus larvae]|uniref:Uncharacterized protein n=3 Tax=Gochnauervirinae TaxID=2842525 RepID=A0A2I7SBY2_9CAUD|nr:hypothetical protein [Paenibacillus larvae]YP_010080160.1 hypothetical protein KMC72_gp07 [Paenibacillus phage Dragolir]YP_010080228.1 putative head-tail connector complex protein [Paenibacillus phage Wanderer]AXF40309.1 putative head-tail connector complex protein [Paenibacillus phage LincolnB]AUS03413.1 hypothetical protein DRAGOLIR_7 [Paenibacillus phage Dragolir]AXF39425.1 putative head-tail connector complex protein [Paenibacillus phage Wanderer]MDT2172601.1 hypothetical protein [Paen